MTKVVDSQLSQLANSNNEQKRNASEPLIEGDLIELECIAYNSKPAANVTWLNGSDSIGDLDGGASSASAPAISAFAPSSGRHLSNQQQQRHTRQRHKRLLHRNQVQLNPDGQTFNTHSFLSIKLSRHEHRAQIVCQAQNEPMRQPMVKSIELQVQRKCPTPLANLPLGNDYTFRRRAAR